MSKEIEIQEVTPMIGMTEVKVIYKHKSYSKSDLREAWCASEMNMKRTFSSSVYKEITFEDWYSRQHNL